MSRFSSDLLMEAAFMAKTDESIEGVTQNQTVENDIKVTTVNIENENAQNSTGKEMGKYITLEVRDYDDKDVFLNAVNLISTKLKVLIDSVCTLDKKHILVAGLGNNYMLADALGPLTINNVVVTRHIKNFLPNLYENYMQEVSAISPGVLGQTGVETAEIIKGMVDNLKPDIVIVIDALASKGVDRLMTSVQMSNTGLSPGGGVGNKRATISREFLGIPVISLGIPTVVDSATLTLDVINKVSRKENVTKLTKLAKEIENEDSSIKYAEIMNLLDEQSVNFIVTPKDVDTMVPTLSKILGYSINKAIHSNMSIDNMLEYIS